jgi:hypothetical protein
VASVFVLVLVLATTLSACGDQSSTGAGSGADSTALPSPSPTDAASGERAQHFVRHWAAALARMETTGKTQEYLKLTLRCPVCRQLARNITHRYARGGYIRWNGLRIRSIDTPPSSGGVVLYTVHAFSSALTFRDSSSRPEQHVPGRRVTYLVGVMATSHSFSVTSVTES